MIIDVDTCQVVHGLSIPLGKAGFYLPKTISRSLTMDDTDEPQSVLQGRSRLSGILPLFRATRSNSGSRNSTEPASRNASRSTSALPAHRIGGTVIKNDEQTANNGSETFVPVSRLEAGIEADDIATGRTSQSQSSSAPNRTIRFGDEAHSSNRASLEQQRGASNAVH